ncbi:MAG: hypothetical protein IOB85_13245 [Methylobacterium sp.]|nr:hypothetical protein [Methylobacterium sp.]MCA3658348.1 hypothetical protein [Methylobacterium sp.]MCA3663935.1 hypothetical protein [Methylobacterium sp.]MCA3673142.1 hypothetical protein [Methylobacterium sp.]MCA3677494.1 hypothetical protein [Methylobacterium sp.]
MDRDREDRDRARLITIQAAGGLCLPFAQSPGPSLQNPDNAGEFWLLQTRMRSGRRAGHAMGCPS